MADSMADFAEKNAALFILNNKMCRNLVRKEEHRSGVTVIINHYISDKCTS